MLNRPTFLSAAYNSMAAVGAEGFIWYFYILTRNPAVKYRPISS